MQKLEVVNMGNISPYPMYFTIRGKDGTIFIDKIKNPDGSIKTDALKKPIEGQFAKGTAKITAAHNKLEVGDCLIINKVEHFIDEIVEERPPSGKRFAEGILFYNLNTSYTRFVG